MNYLIILLIVVLIYIMYNGNTEDNESIEGFAAVGCR